MLCISQTRRTATFPTHFHIMCFIRPIEPDRGWGNKQRREYALDEHVERVLDEAGNTVPRTD